MLNLRFQNLKRILCLGAHADDIEIGAGGTILRLLADNPGLHVEWIVFSASAERAVEARLEKMFEQHADIVSRLGRKELRLPQVIGNELVDRGATGAGGAVGWWPPPYKLHVVLPGTR